MNARVSRGQLACTEGAADDNFWRPGGNTLKVIVSSVDWLLTTTGL